MMDGSCSVNKVLMSKVKEEGESLIDGVISYDQHGFEIASVGQIPAGSTCLVNVVKRCCSLPVLDAKPPTIVFQTTKREIVVQSLDNVTMAVFRRLQQPPTHTSPN
eukprot:GHVQ01006555.1.p1 GENE.GHVQ01006555.1~~GHVQ01006555.1.p1  ORF type:complete len:106 (-),score=13.78 GHVQ01006555.1:686-1003(-)